MTTSLSTGETSENFIIFFSCLINPSKLNWVWKFSALNGHCHYTFASHVDVWNLLLCQLKLSLLCVPLQCLSIAWTDVFDFFEILRGSLVVMTFSNTQKVIKWLGNIWLFKLAALNAVQGSNFSNIFIRVSSRHLSLSISSYFRSL